MIGSCAGSLYALDRSSGDPVWVYSTAGDGPAAQFHGELLLSAGTLIVPTDADPTGHLYAFDSESGDLRWKIPLPQGIATTPLLVGDQIVAASPAGTVLSVTPGTGAIRWKVSPAGSRASMPRSPSPASAKDRIFVSDNTGKVFALSARDGSIIWQIDLSARVNTSLFVTGKTLLAGTADGVLHHISVDSEQRNTRRG